jgi:hypothetical protein
VTHLLSDQPDILCLAPEFLPEIGMRNVQERFDSLEDVLAAESGYSMLCNNIINVLPWYCDR